MDPQAYRRQTAPTRRVDAADIRFTFRHSGKGTTTPVVFFDHRGANPDNFDPGIAPRARQGAQLHINRPQSARAVIR